MDPSYFTRSLEAIPGLTKRLSRGIYVVDVGCGVGLSTMTMAAAFPKSRFLAIDDDPGSIERARQLAAERQVRNVYWMAAPMHHLAPRPTHDLICAFDDIHGDPRATLRAVHDALAEDGVYLWSGSNDRNPIDQDLGTTLERGVRALATEAGFSAVEKLPIPTPFKQFFALRK
jgi:SAM-dependent methyltransferase